VGLHRYLPQLLAQNRQALGFVAGTARLCLGFVGA